MSKRGKSNTALSSSKGKFEDLDMLSPGDLEVALFDAASDCDVGMLKDGLTLFEKTSMAARNKALEIAISHKESKGSLECLRLVLQLHDANPADRRATTEFAKIVQKVVAFDRSRFFGQIYGSHGCMLDTNGSLGYAAVSGSINCLKFLLNYAGKDALGDSLVYASSVKKSACLEALIEKSVETSATMEVKKAASNALQTAALSGSEACVDILLPWSEVEETVAVIMSNTYTTTQKKESVVSMLRRRARTLERRSEVRTRSDMLPCKKQTIRARARL